MCFLDVYSLHLLFSRGLAKASRANIERLLGANLRLLGGRSIELILLTNRYILHADEVSTLLLRC